MFDLVLFSAGDNYGTRETLNRVYNIKYLFGPYSGDFQTDLTLGAKGGGKLVIFSYEDLTCFNWKLTESEISDFQSDLR